MTWKDRLIKEAESIVNHGEGKLNLSVSERSGNKTAIMIECGKSYKFEVEKIIDD